MNKNEVLKKFLDSGILLSPKVFNNLNEDFDYYNLFCIAKDKLLGRGFVSDSDMKEIIDEVLNVDNGVVIQIEKDILGKDTLKENFQYGRVRIVKCYDENIKQKEVRSFVSYFKHRYNSIRNILSSRQELQDSVSISRVNNKRERERVSIIGIVFDKNETKNGNIKLSLEDTTGVIDVLVMKNKGSVYEEAKDVVLDEVIGISGVTGKNIIFCNELFLPEIPLNNELKKSPDEAYAVFISDIHFGIKNFLNLEFFKFIRWLKGEFGNEEQRRIASKVKYLFITGDVVEGVGIYPGQEEDLAICDIYGQYEEAAKYLRMVPEKIKIIMCGGNHDAMRIAEPQPIFDKSISKEFFDISNLIMVSNPSIVNIHSSENFSGLNVLMYHGYSFFYYGENVPSIRSNGGISRCDLIMKFLLQRRHLSPSHGSNLYVADEDYDPMVIDLVPDIFVSGHVHQITISRYRNIDLINSSCWVVQSEDQAKRGMVPHPCKIPIINLQTRQVKIMNFLNDDVKVLVSERLGLKR